MFFNNPRITEADITNEDLDAMWSASIAEEIREKKAQAQAKVEREAAWTSGAKTRKERRITFAGFIFVILMAWAACSHAQDWTSPTFSAPPMDVPPNGWHQTVPKPKAPPSGVAPTQPIIWGTQGPIQGGFVPNPYLPGYYDPIAPKK